MDRDSFAADLAQNGYVVATSVKQPGESRPPHHHPFDVSAMVLAGEVTLVCDGESRVYRAGDRFDMAAGREHAESFGPAGATILTGRRVAG